MYLAQVALYSLQHWYFFCNMSVIKLPRIIFLLIWHISSSVTIPSFLCALQQPCIFAFPKLFCLNFFPYSSLFLCDCFLNWFPSYISIVWEFSFTSLFRIVCQILSSSILRTIPYHVTVLYPRYLSKNSVLCLILCVIAFYTHKRLLSATVMY